MDILSKEKAKEISLSNLADRQSIVAIVEGALSEGRLVTASRKEASGGNHAYTVISRTSDGFRLYNPHGRYVDLKLDDFVQSVFRISISGWFKKSGGDRQLGATPAPKPMVLVPLPLPVTPDPSTSPEPDSPPVPEAPAVVLRHNVAELRNRRNRL